MILKDLMSNNSMSNDFYANVAQVLAITVLALVWNAKYFEKLHSRRFKKTGWRWTPKEIRLYSSMIAVVTIADVAVCLAVLGGLIPNSTGLRIGVGSGLGLALATLLFRMISHILSKDGTGPERP